MKKLKLHILSFSYRKGLPKLNSKHGGGFIFDCRGLKNPGREEQFKQLSGKDQRVAAFLHKLPQAKKFAKASQELVDLTVKSYLMRGFSELGVAFGCTGGQHRSVYFAEKLAKHMRRNSKLIVKLSHRDLPRRIKRQ